jgi:hypothetical protein
MSMTKEELRNALINHGVPSVPPLSAKKDELIALYEEHVAPLENGTGDFSSDDEISLNIFPTKRASTASRLTKISSTSKLSKASSKSPKKSAITEENSLTVDGVDVDALDDDELFKLLKENGIDVGPIVSSTRPFYKKKLALVLKGGESMVNTSNGDEYSDTDPETEPEDNQPAGTTVEETPEPPITRSKSSSSSAAPKSPSKADLTSPFNASGLRQRLTIDEADNGSPLTPTPRRSIHSYKVTETTKQVVTRNKDGVETRDIQHTIERSESQGDKAALNSSVKSGSRISSFICYLLQLIIVLIIVFVIYVVVTTPTEDVTPVDQIMDAINSAQASPDVEAGTRDPAPEASNVADV